MDWITKLKARRAGILDKMEAIVASIPEGEDMTADQVTEFEALKAEDDKVAADLAVAEDLERRRAAIAVSDQRSAPDLQRIHQPQCILGKVDGAVAARRPLAVAVTAQVEDRHAEAVLQGDCGRIPERAIGREAVDQHQIRAFAELLRGELRTCSHAAAVVVME